jgi:hypothetical protein
MKRLTKISTCRYAGFLRIIFALWFASFVANENVVAQNELYVVRNNWLKYSDAPNELYHYLTGQAYDLLKQRADAVAALKTLPEWQQRQKFIRETLLEVVGPFPEKTPLNPKIVRSVEKDGYRIEHIIFESQPGFFVTSSMFIPSNLKKRSKAPAIIYCSGHSAEGYRNPVYLHVLVNLVKKGFIAFAFDPVGQGERLEYFDPKTGKSTIGGPTTEHSYPGAQAFITGSSQARYMIWDGIRAVDYLLTRKEVDPARIGITGRSGGGTQSAYIAAMDERIYAAAPENYLTNFTRLLQTIGPQDAEQNMFNSIVRGLDHPDFLIVRAPKPALMITTTRDMFSIQGVLETEKEVARVYKAYGKEDNFSRTEDDAPHASTKKNREAMYTFFRKHLNNPGNTVDEEFPPLSNEDMKVTATGQVSVSLSSGTVFSLNSKEAGKLLSRLNESRGDLSKFLPQVTAAAIKLSGYREPSAKDVPVFTGRIQREGYAIEKYFVKGEGTYVIPYLLVKPETRSEKALIYLHPSGKMAEISAGGEIEWFVKNGFTVLAPDIIGVGEMGPGVFKGDAYIDGNSHNIWYASMQIGRSVVGIRASDVVKLAGLLRKEEGINEICGLARKEMAPVLLHAAAFDRNIARIALIEPYCSYGSIVMNRFYNPAFIHSTVPGALKAYDLPDLEACIAPRKQIIVNVTDGKGNITDAENINRELAVVRSAYQNRGATGQLTIATAESADLIRKLYGAWIK